jgi:hypothetical protein
MDLDPTTGILESTRIAICRQELAVCAPFASKDAPGPRANHGLQHAQCSGFLGEPQLVVWTLLDQGRDAACAPAYLRRETGESAAVQMTSGRLTVKRARDSCREARPVSDRAGKSRSARRGAIAFLSVQSKCEGDRSHRPVGAAAAKTHHASPDRLRSRTPLAPATEPPSPLLPERLRPFPATIHRLDQALDRRVADRQAQPAITWVVPPVRVVLHIPNASAASFRGSSSEPLRNGPRRAQPTRKPAHTWRT